MASVETRPLKSGPPHRLIGARLVILCVQPALPGQTPQAKLPLFPRGNTISQYFLSIELNAIQAL